MGKTNTDALITQCCKKLGVVSIAKQDKNIHQGRFIVLSVISLMIYCAVVVVAVVIYANQKHYSYECEEEGKLVSEIGDKYIIGICKCKKQEYFSGEMYVQRNISKQYCLPVEPYKQYFTDIFPLCLLAADSRIQSCSYNGVSFSCIILNRLNPSVDCGNDIMAIGYNCESLGICTPIGYYYALKNSISPGGGLRDDVFKFNVTVNNLPVSCCGFNSVDGEKSIMVLVSYIGGALAITHFVVKQVADTVVRKQVCKWKRQQIEPMLEPVAPADYRSDNDYTNGP